MFVTAGLDHEVRPISTGTIGHVWFANHYGLLGLKSEEGKFTFGLLKFSGILVSQNPQFCRFLALVGSTNPHKGGFIHRYRFFFPRKFSFQGAQWIPHIREISSWNQTRCFLGLVPLDVTDHRGIYRPEIVLASYNPISNQNLNKHIFSTASFKISEQLMIFFERNRIHGHHARGTCKT